MPLSEGAAKEKRHENQQKRNWVFHQLKISSSAFKAFVGQQGG
jgi:hypothetical protein